MQITLQGDIVNIGKPAIVYSKDLSTVSYSDVVHVDTATSPVWTRDDRTRRALRIGTVGKAVRSAVISSGTTFAKGPNEADCSVNHDAKGVPGSVKWRRECKGKGNGGEGQTPPGWCATKDVAGNSAPLGKGGVRCHACRGRGGDPIGNTNGRCKCSIDTRAPSWNPGNRWWKRIVKGDNLVKSNTPLSKAKCIGIGSRLLRNEMDCHGGVGRDSLNGRKTKSPRARRGKGKPPVDTSKSSTTNRTPLNKRRRLSASMPELTAQP